MERDLDIIKHLKGIRDPRKDRKKLHLLIDILVIATAAVICGADSWNEIELFGNSKEEWFRKYLELPNGIPSHDTFNRVFSMVYPEEIEKQTIEFFKAKIKPIRENISIDGKTIRRSKSIAKEMKAAHIVSAWLSKSGLSLGQVRVDEKSNEINAIPELLDKLNIQHSIITIDAMGTQKKIAKQIIEKEADYVLALKQNHENLYKDVTEYFQNSYANNFHNIPHKYRKTEEKGHGRIEKREYWLISNLDWLKEREKWTGLNSVGMVRSEIESNGNTTVEFRYYISSLKNTPKLFSDAVRSHWGIENSCHWILDIAFREDESRIRKEYATENFAALRKIALNLLKNEKSLKLGIKGKRLASGWDENYFLKVLGIL